MGLEIEFLPVGRKSKPGDAILVRYGDLGGDREDQTVIVIDGGYTTNGADVVQHVQEYYKTDRVDLVISTHPDQDHINGLKVVIQSLSVDQLWMHRPWMHSRQMEMAKAQGFQELLMAEAAKSFEGAGDLEEAAGALGIPIVEPFAGTTTPDGALQVLGPTESYYESLMAQVRPKTSIRAELEKAAEGVRRWLSETVRRETLTDGGTTSPWNSSSVISLLSYDDRYFLFTADSGIEALTQAADRLDTITDRIGFRWVQVPHHGSRKNVGPKILDRLLGPPGDSEEEAKQGSAYVSVTVDSAPRHPARQVTNAFRRRGYPVCVTAGATIRHKLNAPDRDGWSRIEPLPLFDEVEDFEG